MTTNVLFSSPELTIDGTYNGNPQNPDVHITFVDVLDHGFDTNITLTGLPAQIFVDLFHPVSST